MVELGIYKKKLLLVPYDYSKNNLRDIYPFIEYLSNKFEINILIKDLEHEVISANEYNFVNAKSKLGTYLKYSSDYVIDAGCLNNSYKISNSQTWISVGQDIPYIICSYDSKLKYITSLIKYSDAYDYMISRSPFYSKYYLEDHLLFKGKIEIKGSPKIDKLFRLNNNDIADIKRNLNVPNDKKVILYSPVDRDVNIDTLPFNVLKLQESLNNNYVILLTQKYYLNNNLFDEFIIDCSDYNDITDLMIISDILISDYSSIIFDYSVLERPIILYQFDEVDFMSNRETHFNLKDFVHKGHIITSDNELYKILKENNFEISSQLKETFYPCETGNSTLNIIECLNLDFTTRCTKEIIFLIDNPNISHNTLSFIESTSKYYKLNYNTKIILISKNEFGSNNQSMYKLNFRYIDTVISSEYDLKASSSLLKNTDGYILSLDNKAHIFFQKFLVNKNSIILLNLNKEIALENDIINIYLDDFIKFKLYNYKEIIILNNNNYDLSALLTNDLLNNRVTFINDVFRSRLNSFEIINCKCKFAYICSNDLEEDIYHLFSLGNEVRKQKSSIVINIYGRDEYLDKIEKDIFIHKLEDIMIINRIEIDTNVIFNLNSSLIIFSDLKGNRQLIIDSYEHSKPVVMFNSNSSIIELVKENITGYIVENENYKEFVERLLDTHLINPESICAYVDEMNNTNTINSLKIVFSNISHVDSILKPKKEKKKKRFSFKRYLKYLLRTLRKKIDNFDLYLKENHPLTLLKYRYSVNEFFILLLLYIKNNNSLVSIIIPSYNSKSTIDDTIKSIIKQRYKNIEIIIVDDGSTEKCDYVIKKYSFLNIKYYYKESAGPGIARNFGINKSIGEYVFFLDSDDLLYTGAISNLVYFAKVNNLSVVSALTMQLNICTKKIKYWREQFYTKSWIDDINSRKEIYFDNVSTNKLYTREILLKHNLFFPSGLYEDKVFTTKLYSSIDHIGFTNKIVYIWNSRGDNTSISTTKSIYNLSERLIAIDTQFELVSKSVQQYLFTFFVNHDIRIYLRQYSKYDCYSQGILYDELFVFITKNKEYFYPKMINSTLYKRLIRYILDDDFDKFHLIATLISDNYFNNLLV